MFDETQSLKTLLGAAGKQVNICFDVLTEQLLQRIRTTGCKVLHLTPKMLKMYRECNFLLVEDAEYQPKRLGVDELLSKLRLGVEGKELPLPASLVVLELVNCQPVAQAFQQSGVDNVLYFQLSRDARKTAQRHVDFSLSDLQNRE